MSESRAIDFSNEDETLMAAKLAKKDAEHCISLSDSKHPPFNMTDSNTLKGLAEAVIALQLKLKESEQELDWWRSLVNKWHKNGVRSNLQEIVQSFIDKADKLEAELKEAEENLSAETGRANRLHKRCNMRDEEIEQLEAERDGLKDTMTDIRASVKGILYHHTRPRQSRHGNTKIICEDILGRILIALKEGKEKS